VTEEAATPIYEALVHGVPALAHGQTPPFAVIPGFPRDISPERTRAFQSLVQRLSAFQAAVTAARRASGEDRDRRARDLQRQYGREDPVVPSVAMELLYLLRDCTDWETTLAYIASLPEPLRNLAVVQEQRALATAKSGSNLEAIGALEELIRLQGPTSEREGLLGGRYKKLFQKEPAARQYLDLAIEHYENGMKLDLNDYYPSSNLPRLLRTRGEEGDEEKATAAAYIACTAAERAKERNPKDEWIRPTLLGAAFDAGDVPAAERLYKEIVREGVAAWKLETTIDDLERSIGLLQDSTKQEALGRVLAKLRALIPPQPLRP
jgi:tetratricopeptide (TPR) repeat protein